MSKGLILAALAGGLTYAATRKKTSKKSKSKAAPTVEEHGVGFASKLGTNVSWKVWKRGKKSYFWSWNATNPEHAAGLGMPIGHEDGEVYTSAEHAFNALVDEVGLSPMPEPTDGGEGEEPGIGEPPGPVVSPPQLDFTEPEPVNPHPDDDAMLIEVYPPGADTDTLPEMYAADGMVISPDCQIVAVGPKWWDGLGDSVEKMVGDEILDEDEIMDIVDATWFPDGVDIVECVGPRILRNKIKQRVKHYLIENS